MEAAGVCKFLAGTDTRTRVAAAAVEEDMYAKFRPSVGYFVNCWSVALVNAKCLRRSLTVLQTRNAFCDVLSNADLSIACAAERFRTIYQSDNLLQRIKFPKG